jgi:two-component system sensor histidine kinase DesK
VTRIEVPRWLRPAPDSVVARSQRMGRSPWVEAVHVLWSAWVFVTPLLMPGGYDLRWLLLTLLSYPVFLLLYALTLLAPSRHALRYALAMVAMAMVLLPWYPAGLSYFVFGCVMLRTQSRQSLPRHLGNLLLLNAVLLAWAWWLGAPWQALVWLPLVTLTIGTVVHVERHNQERDHALRLSHDEVRRLAATAERERIGRDLHDLLGHTLSLVALKADLAGRLLRQGDAPARRDAAQVEIAEVSRVARDALTQVRAAVSGIRAAGIAAELASAKLLLECDGVRLDYSYDDRGLAGGVLPPRVESALALTVREAVTNIQRHARARVAAIALSTREGAATLTVSDDGHGGGIVPGNGLSGMRERVEALGGRLQLESSARGGTRLEVQLPLAANDD